MFEYDFVTQPTTWGMSEYHEVVHERSRQGWRLVQVLVEQPAAIASEYVLIFERPASSGHPTG